ncbi:hypothetical protein ARMGADRAFT_1038005 [Armillaria gallica]|uniref:Uncharacterized protein n=1 Tax=Armillaria gallica TaxID=47427 RepID=A0A2H3CMW8_ARMGA|nr:hypothetical protein ARMGADRAFT_1038005 [Armillaria gallica]
MSALPSFTNFAFRCRQGVPSDWTDAHTCSLYDSIVADPIQCTKNVWTPTHIRWMMKSIWFCDKITHLSRVTGVDASILRCQQTAVFRWICPFIQQFCHASIRENVVHSPSFQWDLSNLVGEYWLATSDPVSSDADTGPSNMEGDGNEDVGYGAAQPPATPMDVDLPAPEGEPDGNETGEEWRVTSEMRADSAAAQAAATLAGLVAYGASSDDGSGEDEGEVEEEVKPKRKSSADRKEEEKDCDTNDEREEEEKVDELEGREASDTAPALKKKGYTCTGWLVDLNQRLRQDKTQPAMHAYMVEMEEEGVLEPADKKYSRCHDSNNGHPTCAECLISSHGCPNHIACAIPVKKKATHLDKGKGKVGPAPIKRPQAFMLVPCLKLNSQPPATGEPTQPEPSLVKPPPSFSGNHDHGHEHDLHLHPEHCHEEKVTHHWYEDSDGKIGHVNVKIHSNSKSWVAVPANDLNSDEYVAAVVKWVAHGFKGDKSTVLSESQQTTAAQAKSATDKQGVNSSKSSSSTSHKNKRPATAKANQASTAKLSDVIDDDEEDEADNDGEECEEDDYEEDDNEEEDESVKVQAALANATAAKKWKEKTAKEAKEMAAKEAKERMEQEESEMATKEGGEKGSKGKDKGGQGKKQLAEEIAGEVALPPPPKDTTDDSEPEPRHSAWTGKGENHKNYKLVDGKYKGK